MDQETKTQKFLFWLLGGLFEVFAGVLGLSATAGGIVFVWQIFGFLRFGVWESMSVITMLAYFGSSWAAFPINWLGVHSILNSIPLSLALISFPFLVFCVLMMAFKRK